ncbi:hypothetical protein [Streptomyces sp. NPDC060001]|uniref:hypothetical protein n=1 Tax=Streptomyces sp. NPDC060001 TaxID=3347032 RepID=UPI003681F0AF
MPDARLNCGYEGGDYVTGSVDADGDFILRAYKDHFQASTVMPSHDAVRTFARQILALVGDATADEPVKVGDFVEVTKDREYDTSDVGKRGRVTQIDSDDIPYRVDIGGGESTWVMEVRKVASTTSGSRAERLDEARRVAGPGATSADVLAYAKYLDGE